MDSVLQQILDGCIAGDRASQKQLYYRYCNVFMAIAIRYVNTQADAEEVLNNSFLRIFKHAGKYSGKGSFEGWMKRIVVNCCLTFISQSDYSKQSKVVTLKDYAFGSEVGHQPGSLFIGEPLEEKYHQEFLLNLLRHLPETTRMVFNLYVFEEYSHSDIGEIMGIAERTSQSHLAKARQILSNRLDKKELISKMQRV